MSRPPVEDRIQFKIHPRVFAALGADLVTNDVVAVIELVKNSYDAFASRVDVVFAKGNGQGRHLDIVDDGVGMDRKTLEESWGVVATPYRTNHPVATRGTATRRVSGAKGLGRLSAARLGRKLEMLTKSAAGPAWLVTLDWSDLTKESTLEDCFAVCRAYRGALPFDQTGTRVRVLELTSEWDADQVHDLEENLARLISPFSAIKDFAIFLSAPDLGPEALPTEILAPEFLSHPPYAIRGHVTRVGEVKARYEFQPIGRGMPRKRPITVDWSDVRKNSVVARKLAEREPECGPFEFEIRAWDIGPDDAQDISSHFDIAKGNVRKAIRAHKGISVYRDGILVLPKVEENRDWLGLDLRRVSKVGTRLSTSQIVGYVSITALENSGIEDTSNREGLARNPAVLAFQEILKATVSELESQRDEDRLRPSDRVELRNLLEGVSGDELVKEISAVVKEGGDTEELLTRVTEFNSRLEVLRDALKTRLVYYSRLATMGTIAQMLVHEIRNRTTSIGRFLRFARKELSDCADGEEFEAQISLTEASVDALEKLADTFAPLASRSFRRGRRDSIAEESISRCTSLLKGDIRREGVQLSPPLSTRTEVAVDPGELDTIILNLLQNSLYWIPKGGPSRELELTVRKRLNQQRAQITVSDSGSGVSQEDAERIFLPGVTNKPGGIGMGLTVAAELVSDYGGKLALVQPGKLGGATFTFDVPLKD
jgi:signal transduction histidine kinase